METENASRRKKEHDFPSFLRHDFVAKGPGENRFFDFLKGSTCRKNGFRKDLFEKASMETKGIDICFPFALSPRPLPSPSPLALSSRLFCFLGMVQAKSAFCPA